MNLRIDAQPLTLGALIGALALRPGGQPVLFDFGRHRPDGFDSYRGFYDHLALGYVEGHETVTVDDLLTQAKGCVGEVFTGYKGGQFRMDLNTPVWVANPGECPSSCLVGVDGDDIHTILVTGWCRGWMGEARRTLQVLSQGLGYGNLHLTDAAGAPRTGA